MCCSLKQDKPRAESGRRTCRDSVLTDSSSTVPWQGAGQIQGQAAGSAKGATTVWAKVQPGSQVKKAGSTWPQAGCRLIYGVAQARTKCINPGLNVSPGKKVHTHQPGLFTALPHTVLFTPVHPVLDSHTAAELSLNTSTESRVVGRGGNERLQVLLCI